MSDHRRTPHADYRFWLYDPESEGMTYFRTAEDRDQAAAAAISAYCNDGDEGWWEEALEAIAAGEVTHVAMCKDKTMRPDDLDEEGCDGEGTYWAGYAWMGNYTFEPLPVPDAPEGESEGKL